MAERRYYWLKLPANFFSDKDIKKLRRVAGGDTYTVIYLKMLLRSLSNGGRLYYDGVEETFPDELALDIDEDAEDVKMTVAFLMARGLLTQTEPDEYDLTAAKMLTGSETPGAERMRRMREKAKASQCYAVPSQCDKDVTGVLRSGDVEIEKEIDIDISKPNGLDDIYRPDFSDEKPDDTPVKRKKRTYPHESTPYRAAAALARLMTENTPAMKPPGEAAIQTWADSFRLLNERDGYDWDLINDVLVWCQDDPFWSRNILSGPTFRKQFGKLLVQMEAKR